MKIILSIDKFLDKISGWILITLLGIMIVMAFGQVVLRNFFHTSIEWGDIFLRHLVLWVGFLGAVIATGQRRHLRIEFVSKIVPQKVRKIFFIITNLFAAIVVYLLMQAAISFVELEFEDGGILLLDIPRWYFISIIPIGYAMAAFRFLVHSLQWLIEIFHGNWETESGAAH
ncbi:MAG: TRAP transporter small permease [Bacteroidetes bacterium]|nr:TRAP transporter small permease [Bacteroidota bacterium]